MNRAFSQQLAADIKSNFLTRLIQRIIYAADYPTGPDVSYHQGVIDWDKLVAKSSFSIIRAGYGNANLDVRLEYNVSSAAARGLPYGLYWYVMPAYDPKKHAANFAAAYQSYGGSIPPTFDLEETGGLDKYDLLNWYTKLYNRFAELTGLDYPDMMTYTSAGFLDRAIPLTGFIKHTQLWVACWTTAPQPIIPKEWSVAGKTWTYWQYTSKGKGSDYGAQSRYIDLNRKNVFSPPPPGDEEMRYRVIATPHLNVRAGPGTQYAIVGNMPTGTEFTISDAMLGSPTCSIWLVIKGGQYDGNYSCLQINQTRYCQAVS